MSETLVGTDISTLVRTRTKTEIDGELLARMLVSYNGPAILSGLGGGVEATRVLREEIANRIRDHAKLATERSPLPRDFWDSWVLGRTKEFMAFGNGVNLPKNDFVLVKPRSYLTERLTWNVSIWSPRSDIGLATSVDKIEILQAPTNFEGI